MTPILIGVFVIKAVQEGFTSLGPTLVEKLPFLGGDIVFASMNVFLGGVIAAFLIFEPRGLMHRWNILKLNYRLWPFHH